MNRGLLALSSMFIAALTLVSLLLSVLHQYLDVVLPALPGDSS